jgi:hypothetical protein
MRRSPRPALVRSLALASCAAIALLTGSCGGDGTPDTIIGLITEVRLDDEGKGEFIRLRDRDDEMWDLEIHFDPGAEVVGAHLQEHKDKRLPVIVKVRESDSGLYAARIDDVPPDE